MTPVLKVSGGGSGTAMIAGLIATRPGRTLRLIYRIRLRRNRKSLGEADYAALLDTAHQQLGGPLVVARDNLSTHVSAKTCTLIDARSWLAVIRLPSYAPEINPVEPVWARLKRSLANMAKKRLDELARLVKTRLKKMQYRPRMISGFIAKTRLDFKPP